MNIHKIGIFVSVVDGFGKGVTFTCTDENAALKLQTALLATRSFSVSTQQPADNDNEAVRQLNSREYD